MYAAVRALMIHAGHPSCMQLENMGDAMRSYEWQCATCKSCSVCRRKGNEVRSDVSCAIAAFLTCAAGFNAHMRLLRSGCVPLVYICMPCADWFQAGICRVSTLRFVSRLRDDGIVQNALRLDQKASFQRISRPKSHPRSKKSHKSFLLSEDPPSLPRPTSVSRLLTSKKSQIMC